MCKIPAKESLSVEFKSDKKCLSNSILLDAVVGLANTDGGTLYLGVEDDGEITGLHRSHMDVLPVMAFVANLLFPCARKSSGWTAFPSCASMCPKAAASWPPAAEKFCVVA